MRPANLWPFHPILIPTRVRLSVSRKRETSRRRCESSHTEAFIWVSPFYLHSYLLSFRQTPPPYLASRMAGIKATHLPRISGKDPVDPLFSPIVSSGPVFRTALVLIAPGMIEAQVFYWVLGEGGTWVTREPTVSGSKVPRQEPLTVLRMRLS